MNRVQKFACAALAAAMPLAYAADPKADGLWRGTGGAALAVTSGNSSTQAMNLNTEMVNITAVDKITLGAGISYAKSKGSAASTNKWAAAGQYDYNLTPRTFVFGKLGLEGDKVANLDLRTTVAGGVGYKVIESKPLNFNVFGGVAYSKDKYTTGPDASRTSLMLGEESSHVLSDTTSFRQRLELYPGLSGDKAKIAKFSAGLSVAMSSTLSLNVGLTDTYNSKPPAGFKKNDMALFTGINVKLGAM